MMIIEEQVRLTQGFLYVWPCLKMYIFNALAFILLSIEDEIPILCVCVFVLVCALKGWQSSR